jgi:hypothetical protein
MMFDAMRTTAVLYYRVVMLIGGILSPNFRPQSVPNCHRGLHVASALMLTASCLFQIPTMHQGKNSSFVA